MGKRSRPEWLMEFPNNRMVIALNEEEEKEYELQTDGVCCNHPIVKGRLIWVGIDATEIQDLTVGQSIYSIEEDVDNLIRKYGLSLDRTRHSEEGMIAINEYGGNAYLLYENSD